MKILFSIVYCSLLSQFTFAQTLTIQNIPWQGQDYVSIDFEGAVPKKGYKKVLHLQNTGKQTLIIESIEGGCDCTKVRLKKKQLLPQEKTTLIIRWNPSQDTEFSGSITIKSNDSSRPEAWLELLANVED